jgi:hypothetical protein
MNRLNEVLRGVDAAQELLAKAESERDAFLTPILEALELKGRVESFYVETADRVSVTLTGSHRGYGWHDDFTIPLGIFTCSDPVEAAKAYRAKQRADDEEQARKAKIAEALRVLAELGDH